jgi:hypothetical protein
MRVLQQSSKYSCRSHMRLLLRDHVQNNCTPVLAMPHTLMVAAVRHTLL